jgi:undecaprenyl-diphosphatase
MLIPFASAAETQILALAQAAGAHAFAWGGSLVGLLLSCAAVWSAAAMQRAAAPGAGMADLLPARSEREGAIAYPLLAIAIGSFAVVAWQTGAGGVFADFDRAFSAAAQASAPPWLLQAASGITMLGDGFVLGVLCVVAALGLLAVREPVLAIGLAVAMGGNGVLNGLLKHAFARQRPLHLAGLPQYHGSGFPSSHASGSLVAYGMLSCLLLWLLPRRWHKAVVCVAAAIVLAVGSSRIVLGAHYASDVVAGLASGAAWLILCMLALRRLRRHAVVGSARIARDLPTGGSRAS